MVFYTRSFTYLLSFNVFTFFKRYFWNLCPSFSYYKRSKQAMLTECCLTGSECAAGRPYRTAYSMSCMQFRTFMIQAWKMLKGKKNKFGGATEFSY